MSTIADRNAAALAAPISVTLGDATYLASPPTPSDMLTYREEMKRQLIAAGVVRDPVIAVAQSLRDIPPEFHQVFAEAAVRAKAGGGVEPTEEALSAQLNTPDGASFMLWLLASKNQPGLKVDEIRGKITDVVVARDVLAQLGKMLVATEKKDGGSGGSTGSLPAT